jgi:hypothetical protein
MKIRIGVIGLACLFVSCLQAQDTLQTERLKLFVDCKQDCDLTFLRSEMSIVDFVIDNKAADVFILITSLENGGGGKQFQLITSGQNNFKDVGTDTIKFNTKPNATDFEIRQDLSRQIKITLLPFLSKTQSINDVAISFKPVETENKDGSAAVTKDRWNYWVFNINASGDLNRDVVYQSFNQTGKVSASRITDKLKVSFTTTLKNTRSGFELVDSSGAKKIVVKNYDYNFNHQAVKSLSEHWSYGYEAAVSRSNFSNNKLRLRFNPAIEYDIFPYKSVNTKFLTIRYGVDIQRNSYYDTTVFNKTQELLYGQGLTVYMSLKQKWGSTAVSLNYHNYLHNPKLYYAGMTVNVDVRITGNISFTVKAYGGLVRDQIALVKAKASDQDVLVRRRQVASSYNYWSNFGINYRFGSKLNNFVNPRFDEIPDD